MTVSVLSRGARRGLVKKRPVRHIISVVSREEGVDPLGELNVLLTTDEEIQDLNCRFLGIDTATDVIAFGHDDPEGGETFRFAVPDDAPGIIGDVVISVETAVRQAEENGLSLEQELALLTVHGVLHLVGYEDTAPAEKRKMRRRQREIMLMVYPDLEGRL